MRILTIKEVLLMGPGELVPGISAVLKAVLGRRAGGDGDKAWTLETIMLQDGKDELKCCIWNHEKLSASMKGKKIWIMSRESEKGLSGIKMEDNEWENDKGLMVKTKQLSVSARAKILDRAPTEQPQFPVEEGAEEFGPQPPDDVLPPPELDEPTAPIQSPTPEPTLVPARAPKISWKEADTELMKLRTLRLRTIDVTMSINAEVQKRHGEVLPLEWLQAIDSWLAICCERRGLQTRIPAKLPLPLPPQNQE